MSEGDEYIWITKPFPTRRHGMRNGDRVLLPTGKALRVLSSQSETIFHAREWRWHDWIALVYWRLAGHPLRALMGGRRG